MITYNKSDITVILPPIKPQPQQSTNFLFSLLEMIGVGITAFGVGLLAETLTAGYATPAVAVMFGYLAEDAINILGNIAVDYFNGNLNDANVILDIGIPLLRMPARTMRLYKTSNLIRRMGFEIERPNDLRNFQKLQKELYQRNWDNLNMDSRKFKYLEEKYDLKNVLWKWRITQESVAIRKANLKTSAIFFKYVRKASRTIALGQPRYLFYRTINFLGKKTVGKIASYLKKFEKQEFYKFMQKWHEVFKKGFQLTTKNIVDRTNMIPVNSSWIIGFKLISISTISPTLHIIVVFNPITTNGKRDVFINNMPKLMFERWLLSSSIGKFYIDNVAWGWEIGRWIRNNSQWGNLRLAGLIGTRAIGTLFNIKRTIDLVQKSLQPNYFVNLWKQAPLALRNALIKYFLRKGNVITFGFGKAIAKQFVYHDPNAVARTITFKLKKWHKRKTMGRMRVKYY